MSIDELRQNFNTLKQELAALRAQAQDRSKELLHAEFRAFFEKHGESVKSVFWTQYTPYFNDGEPCRFSVGDLYLLLWEDAENADISFDGEGSVLYDTDSIQNLERRIAKWKSYLANPREAALQYQRKHIERANYDPFAPDRPGRYMGRTAEQKIADWRPDYVSLNDLEQELEQAHKFVSQYPGLSADFDELATMFASIDDELMEDMFGDHVLVTVTRDGIETEHYSHD